MKKCTRPLLALLALTIAHQSQAAVVYSGTQNIPIPNTFVPGLYINIFSGATLTSSTDPATWNTQPWFSVDLGGEDIFNGPLFRPVVLGLDRVENMAFGTSVSSANVFASGASASVYGAHLGPAPDQFHVYSAGYMGYAFQPTTGGPTHYGWVRLTVNNTGVGTGTIHDWAYEDAPNTGISVGAIPEPSAAVFLAFGLSGLVLRRARRICA